MDAEAMNIAPLEQNHARILVHSLLSIAIPRYTLHANPTPSSCVVRQDQL